MKETKIDKLVKIRYLKFLDSDNTVICTVNQDGANINAGSGVGKQYYFSSDTNEFLVKTSDGTIYVHTGDESNTEMPVGAWWGGETRCIFVPPVDAYHSTKLIVNAQNDGTAVDETDSFSIYQVNLDNLSATEMLISLRDTANINSNNNINIDKLLGVLRRRTSPSRRSCFCEYWFCSRRKRNLNRFHVISTCYICQY